MTNANLEDVFGSNSSESASAVELIGEAIDYAADRERDGRMDFARSVVRGLSDTPRRLESRHIYDAYGSELFERICEQPEYYLTRVEARLLETAATDIASLTGDVSLIELGSGSSAKTQRILEAYAERFGGARYTPVDVSREILEFAKREIETKHPTVTIEPLHGTYDEAFPLARSLSPAMLLFLGSTVGNLSAAESSHFWTNVSAHLSPGSFCLLGIDITDDSNLLHAAYNDEAGYSKRFTRNIFERMNRELGATIDTTAIEHVAKYNRTWRRVEIFARFKRTQTIDVSPLGRSFTIEAGEHILTEISRKFRAEDVALYLHTFGLETRKIYTDDRKHVALLLLERV